jgi:TonB family protein
MGKVISVLLLWIPAVAFGQREIIVRVLDDDNNKPVEQVYAYLPGETVKTYSNRLGYFSLPIGPADTIFRLRHPGYEPATINIPLVDKFRVLMIRKVVDLGHIELESLWDLDIPSLDSLRKMTALSKDVATYPGGNDYFTLAVGKQMRTKRFSKMMSDDTLTIYFTVAGDGKPAEIGTLPQSDSLREALTGVMDSLYTWQPIKENGIGINQFFMFSVTWHASGGGERMVRSINSNADVPGGYKGGMNEFYKYVAKNLQYPVEAGKKGIQGKVYVQFTIERDGTINDVRAIESPSEILSKEAIRIVRSASQWKPAVKGGKSVRSRMTLPITFAIRR